MCDRELLRVSEKNIVKSTLLYGVIPQHRQPPLYRLRSTRYWSKISPVMLIFFLLTWFSTAKVEAASQTPEKEISDTVEVVCPQLVALNEMGSLNSAEQDLLIRCGEVKIKESAGQQVFDDLTSAQKNALSQMTSDETDAIGRLSVEITGGQLAAISGRLEALRDVISPGLASNTKDNNPKPIMYAGPITAVETSPDSDAQDLDYFGGRLGGFINGTFGSGEKDPTHLEPGFDFDNWGITAGIDYRVLDNWFLGGAFGYSEIETEIDNSAGDTDVDGYAVSLYTTYYLQDFYISAIGSYVKKDYKMIRNVKYTLDAVQVNQQFDGDTDAKEYFISGEFGYEYVVNSLTLTPYARLNYLRSEIDGYTEELRASNTDPGFGLALDINDQNITSVTSALGSQVTYAIGTEIGVFTPHVRFEWVHEFENDARTISGSFINGTKAVGNIIIIPTDDSDSDYFNLGAGVAGTFAHGISAFLVYDTTIGLSDITNHQVTGGVRIEF